MQFLKTDPQARVACETLVSNNLVVLAGEITTKANVDYEKVARAAIQDVGYDDEAKGLDYRKAEIMVRLNSQSPDISQGVTEGEGLHAEQGAGDQGMMFGYAVNETPEFMPLSIDLSHKLVHRMAELRHKGAIKWLRPDSKSQVTVEYENGAPKRVDTVVISTQHDDDVQHAEIKEAMIEDVIKKIVPAQYLDARTKYHVNPTGRFVVGGPPWRRWFDRS